MTTDPLILCATPALARRERVRHAVARQSAGERVWAAPNIADVEGWIARQWAATWPAERLLSGAQELALWQRIVDDDPDTDGLISTRGLARQARSTARMAARHCIDVAAAPAWTPEQAAFQRWHARYQAALKDHGWLTTAQLPAAALTGVDDSGFSRPGQVDLLGFVHAPEPAQQALLDRLAAAGSQVRQRPPPRPAAQCRAVQAVDDDAQWAWLGQQVAAHLADAADAGQPAPDIVIACADPAEHRTAIASGFAPAVAPWLQHAGHGRMQPWRVEPAPPLAEHPLIAAALAVLAVERWRNPFPTMSRVLLCGALWRGADRQAAALLEATLRSKAAPAVHLTDCVRWAPERLGQRMQAWMQAVERAPRRATPGAWAAQFFDQLRALGWPGELARGSEAFQAAQALREALAGLAGLDAQLGSVGRHAALGWLQELLSSKPWSPRVEHLQPVLITDFEQAAGLPADLRYVLDTGDDAWPGAPVRRPLLAHEVLVAAGVPRSTPADCLAHAQRAASGLLADADTVCLVLAQTDRSGSPRVPAGHWPAGLEWQAVDSPRPGRVRHTLAAPAEDRVPPVLDPEAEGVRGGTRIFESYVAAPLFAFVHHRLGVDLLDEAPAGLSAMQQGAVIHAVLDMFWAAVGDSAGLARLGDAALKARVSEHVDQALDPVMDSSRHPAVLRAAEAARLADIVTAWLAHERRRDDPFTVLARERAVAFDFAGLALRLQLDRVDRVDTADGPRHLVLDYKTGKAVNTGGWFADRITQPQLPLYATPQACQAAGIPSVDGIGFAHVHWRRPALAAATNWASWLIDTGQRARRRPAEFEAELAGAHARLHAMATGFLAGELRFERKHAASHPLAVLLPPAPQT